MMGSMRVILVAHRIEEVVRHITHVLFVKKGQIFMQGPKDQMLTSENISGLYDDRLHVEKRDGGYHLFYGMEEKEKADSFSASGDTPPDSPDILIEMKDTTVAIRGAGGSPSSELDHEKGGELGDSRAQRLRQVDHPEADPG